MCSSSIVLSCLQAGQSFLDCIWHRALLRFGFASLRLSLYAKHHSQRFQDQFSVADIGRLYRLPNEAVTSLGFQRLLPSNLIKQYDTLGELVTMIREPLIEVCFSLPFQFHYNSKILKGFNMYGCCEEFFSRSSPSTVGIIWNWKVGHVESGRSPCIREKYGHCPFI